MRLAVVLACIDTHMHCSIISIAVVVINHGGSRGYAGVRGHLGFGQGLS